MRVLRITNVYGVTLDFNAWFLISNHAVISGRVYEISTVGPLSSLSYLVLLGRYIRPRQLLVRFFQHIHRLSVCWRYSWRQHFFTMGSGKSGFYLTWRKYIKIDMEIVSTPLAHLVFIHRNRTFVKFSKGIFCGVKLWQITENSPNSPKFCAIWYMGCRFFPVLYILGPLPSVSNPL